MSGTALDHRLVRDYLRDLDKAMRGLPDTQAHELKEQITAHLDDALQPGAGDDEVAATLSRLGSPADLAAEAGAASGSSGPGLALSGRRVGWRLAAIIAVPAVIAAVLGALQISGDVSSYAASGRVQHLARLDAAVVTLTQKLEDERDLSAAYAAREDNGPLTRARAATDAAASAVRGDAAGVGAGYSPGTVQDLKALLAGLTVLGDIRGTVSAPGVIPLYSLVVIGPAITFSTAAGEGTGDPRLQASVTTLAALLKVENEMSVQRAILYAALSARPPVLAPADLTSLLQAVQQQHADLSDFNASTDTTEQRLFSNTVSGVAVDRALEAEARAEAGIPVARLTGRFGLDAATWYSDMSRTIDDTREVANQLVGQVTTRAGALRSDATRRLVLTSIATLGLLLLVLLISAAVGRSLTRPPRR
jgi:hypothetical protein